MRTNKQIALIAALIVGSSAWLPAQNNNQGQNQGQTPSQGLGGQRQIGQPADQTLRTDQKSTNLTTGAQSMQPVKINKASSFIGSTVKNQQGERLGKIHDVVLDFNSDRVSYVVLSTSSGILSSEKLHAVPLRAFQVDSDGTSVTLNSDKDKLTTAESFDKNNWPSMNNTTWGAEPFWKDRQSTNTQSTIDPTGKQDADQQYKGDKGDRTNPTTPKDSEIKPFEPRPTEPKQ